jgi:hypothetical protein
MVDMAHEDEDPAVLTLPLPNCQDQGKKTLARAMLHKAARTKLRNLEKTVQASLLD